MDLELTCDLQQPTPSSDWAYLDSQQFREKFTSPSEPFVMRFYVEGVGCSKCLAKIENLKRSYSQVVEASMDMSKNILRLKITPQGSFAQFILGLENLGYKAHPISEGQDQSKLQSLENRKMLKRIGVAAFCTGNIMLFAISSYGGVSGLIEKYFNWLSLFLAIPVLSYSATPFYKSLWLAIKDRRPSIDLPIVAALLIGFSLSAYHTFIDHGDVYFDTLTTLVFLLLSARYFLKRIQQSYLSSSFFLPFLNLDKVRIWDEALNRFEMFPLEKVQSGQRLLVLKGEKVPVDGTALITGAPAFINNAFLTGESLPVKVNAKDSVYAGAELVSAQLEIEVTATGENTRLGSLFEKMEEEVLRRTPLLTLTDKLAKWFTVTTLTMGALFFAYYATIDLTEATRRSLALVILACPCALALATPLTQSLSLLKAAKLGYVIKTAEVLEKLRHVTQIAFDKTGTLTEGRFQWISWIVREPTNEELQLIYALEANSHHPIAKAYLAKVESSNSSSLEICDWKEVHGRGVEAKYQKDRYEIHALDEDHYDKQLGNTTQVGFYKNDELQFAAAFGDQIRSDSKELISRLKKLGFNIHLLSGDSEQPVTSVAEQIKVPTKNAHAQMTPESKLEWIKSQTPKTIMVGDGANDAAALAASYLSVAVQGSMEVSLHAADIYLSKSGVTPIYHLLRLGQDTMNVVYRNLGFSLVYNLVGGVAALLGYVNPLVAAILMPISSLCVLASSVWGTKYLRRLSTLVEGER
ncbi:MAG: heavy metal translocating P-type ATPase [Bdellovibrionales bacterium]|nr:heavy metal translocating P-type ATPase [Bdellovibrionales bacterium]